MGTRPKRSDGSINYYDGNRTPSPAYTETKASILRRRKNHQPNQNEGEDLEEALNSLQHYASLQDLHRLQYHNEGVPFSKHHSTTSLANQPTTTAAAAATAAATASSK